MKRGVEINKLCLVLTVLVLVGCSNTDNGRIDEQECTTDSDCVQVQTTCCPCNNGGKQECMANSKAKEYEEKLKNCQEDIICLSVYNCKRAECSCKENKCA